MEKLKVKDNFLNGLIKNNPVFVLVLGMCPMLAMSYNLQKAFAMGVATMFVLICSNTFISLLRKLIPDKVRVPAYLIIISTFVITVQMVMKKFTPALYTEMSAFIALIVVNCIIFARAESFASSNKVLDSFIDGVSSGLGFLCAISLLGLCREIITSGAILGYAPFANNKSAALNVISIIVLTLGVLLVFTATILATATKKDYRRQVAYLLLAALAAFVLGGMLTGSYPKMSGSVSSATGFIIFAVLMAVINQIRLTKGGNKK